MTDIHEIQIRSTGFPGGPGFTNLYFLHAAADEDGQFARVKSFLNAEAQIFPNAWRGQIQATGRVLNAETGALVGFTAAPVSALVASTGQAAGSGFGAGVAGLAISWSTASVNRLRRVRGRTFLVPLSNDAYDADGTLSASTLANGALIINTLITIDNTFVVWSRPRLGTGGLAALVVSARIADKAAFLSSRRD